MTMNTLDSDLTKASTKTAKKFDENRIFVIPYPNRYHPGLAKEIGLHESLLLLQIEFWTSISKHPRHNGYRWTYASVTGIQKALFPFLNEKTIRKVIKKLQSRNLILTGNFNKKGYDKTRWYAINVPEVAKLKSIAVYPEILSEYGILEAETLDVIDEEELPW